jgi:hypothetical protein
VVVPADRRIRRARRVDAAPPRARARPLPRRLLTPLPVYAAAMPSASRIV